MKKISLRKKQECLWMFKQGLGYKRISNILNLNIYTVRDYGRRYHGGDSSFAKGISKAPKDKKAILLVKASLKYPLLSVGEICTYLDIEKDDIVLNYRNHERIRQDFERRVAQDPRHKVYTKDIDNRTRVEVGELYTQEPLKRAARRPNSRKEKQKAPQKKRCAKVDELVGLGLSVSAACKACKVSRSMYYRSKTLSNKERRDSLLYSLLSSIQKERYINYTYGVQRLSHEINHRLSMLCEEDRNILLLNGQSTINHKRVHRLMKEFGLSAHIKRRKYPKDYYKRKKQEKDNMTKNILDRKFFDTPVPMRKLATDVTYLPCKDVRFIYLSPVMDLMNEEIVSFSISYSNSSDLAISMLENIDKDKVKGALLHSDQGSIYRDERWIKLCDELNITRSMSRRANCWDNSVIECFFSRLKSDLRLSKSEDAARYDSRTLIKLVADYIHWYNNSRIQKRLNYMSPVLFRESLASQ